MDGTENVSAYDADGLDLCAGMRRFISEVDDVYAALPENQTIADQRRTYLRMARKYTRQRPAGITVRDVMVPAASHGPIRVRVYQSDRRSADLSPGIVFMHGGGFALGSIESHDCVAAELALASSSVVLSVDYRLAPEHPFPAAFEDANAVWQFALANPERFGLDPDRIIVAGDSAGAALAAAICLDARDKDRAMPRGQLLIYPVLTARGDLPSYEEQADAPMLTAHALEYFWDLYTEAGKHADNPLAAPLMATDLSDLPDCFIATANHDPCRDDGVTFARRLQEAGVRVDLRCAPKLTHGYLRARAMSPAAATEFAAICEAARGLLRDESAAAQDDGDLLA
ncbi:MAG: alpha/beta hydrolase [Alphaproteobacteria bacterium]|nr:alpha/beta hydrolase [Alphaproteobacteria bacterium]